jgi:hypothetical protein
MAATESVRLPKVIVKAMRELALKEGRTISGQIVFLINMALKQKS